LILLASPGNDIEPGTIKLTAEKNYKPNEMTDNLRLQILTTN